MLRTTVVSALTAGLGLVARAAWGIPTAMGASAAAARAIAAASPQFDGESFRNPHPATVVASGGQCAILRGLLTRRHAGDPPGTIPVLTPRAPAVASTMAVTWYGHASALVEVDGRRVLVDPMWGDRASPSRLLGPKRLHPVPIPLDDVPPLDAVVISHDHYDHLDLPTIRRLAQRESTPFVVPLGVGAHLRGWGVPTERIVELDWGQTARVRELTLTCTEARHFSGRGLTRNTTLWASWVIAGPQHGVFFGGDTGYTPAFAEIGARYGPFDLTLLPIGAYGDSWPDIHLHPEDAVRAHGDVGGGVLVPMHWATFNLAFHGWAEPVRRLCAAAERTGVRVAVPRPGERLELSALPPSRDWWNRLG